MNDLILFCPDYFKPMLFCFPLMGTCGCQFFVTHFSSNHRVFDEILTYTLFIKLLASSSNHSNNDGNKTIIKATGLISKALLGRFLFHLCTTNIVKIDQKGNTINIIVALISKTIAS